MAQHYSLKHEVLYSVADGDTLVAGRHYRATPAANATINLTAPPIPSYSNKDAGFSYFSVLNTEATATIKISTQADITKAGLYTYVENAANNAWELLPAAQGGGATVEFPFGDGTADTFTIDFSASFPVGTPVIAQVYDSAGNLEGVDIQINAATNVATVSGYPNPPAANAKRLVVSSASGGIPASNGTTTPPHELTQAEAEGAGSTVFGMVSGERLAQAMSSTAGQVKSIDQTETIPDTLNIVLERAYGFTYSENGNTVTVNTILISRIGSTAGANADTATYIAQFTLVDQSHVPNTYIASTAIPVGFLIDINGHRYQYKASGADSAATFDAAQWDDLGALPAPAAKTRGLNVVRANATAGVAPTTTEVPDPINGDSATVTLNNSVIEVWQYAAGAWGLKQTITPVILDKEHFLVQRANATAAVAPTALEAASPNAGDTASVFLNNGNIESWAYTTTWGLVHTTTAITLDGHNAWISRASATAGTAPTAGEFPSPIAGCTAVVLLNNTIKEYWTYTTAWALTSTDTGDRYNKQIVRTDAVTGVAPTAVEFASPINGCTATVWLTTGVEEHWNYTAGAWVLTQTMHVLLPADPDGTGEALVRNTDDTLAYVTGLRLGYGAGNLNSNVVLGNGALAGANTANSLVAVGFNALNANTTGAANTGVGIRTLMLNTTGANNVALGANALRNNVAGSANLAIGASAMVNSTGSNNVAVGQGALQNQTSGANNIAIGFGAGNGITTATGNVVLGPYVTAISTNNGVYVADGSGTLAFESNTAATTSGGTARSFKITGDTFRFGSLRTPATSAAAGQVGEMCADANYVYVCVAANTWKRAALVAF